MQAGWAKMQRKPLPTLTRIVFYYLVRRNPPCSAARRAKLFLKKRRGSVAMEDNYNNDITTQEIDYKKELSANLGLEDKGSAFGRYKKMFFLLIGIGLVYILVFLMYTAKIISLFFSNCILIPFTLLILAVCSKFISR